jgi:hypothetical protein
VTQEGFLVEPCLGPPLLSETAPSLRRVDRLALDQDRELVQIQLGTQPGMVTYALGLVALLAREQDELRVLALNEASGSLESGLSPYARAEFAGTEVVLQTQVTGPEREDWVRATYVAVSKASPSGLRYLGSLVERSRSHEAFWRGPYDWEMTSGGKQAEPAGFVVHERWQFTHRRTHRRSQRSLDRHYRLDGDTLVATPPNDLDTWPETSTQGWPPAD